MAHQPNLFSSTPAKGSAASTNSSLSNGSLGAKPGRSRHWLRRVELFFYVIVRIYVGAIVLVLPWTSLWAANHLFGYFPNLSALLMSGAARGIISGLGLLNLWIAVDEAVHYREYTP